MAYFQDLLCYRYFYLIFSHQTSEVYLSQQPVLMKHCQVCSNVFMQSAEVMWLPTKLSCDATLYSC